MTIRGDEVLVITPAGRRRITALPKGAPHEGETERETAGREVREETGVTVEVGERLGDVSYVYRRDGRRIQKVVHYYLCTFVAGSTEITTTRSRSALDPAPGGAHGAHLSRRAAADRTRHVQAALSWTAYGSPAVQVLNFYSTVFADQMKRGRKTATIRLGDKRHKYRKNQVVLVTVGYQYSPREKLFHAVIDNVDVKRVKDLSPRDIEHDNPEFRRTEELVHFLEQIYGREVSLRTRSRSCASPRSSRTRPTCRIACGASAGPRTRSSGPSRRTRTPAAGAAPGIWAARPCGAAARWRRRTRR